MTQAETPTPSANQQIARAAADSDGGFHHQQPGRGDPGDGDHQRFWNLCGDGFL